jgi:membrane-associated phospholipid phosphatase
MIFLAANFWQKIISWDQQLFEKINTDWTNPALDALMPFVRNPLNWAPLYLFLFVFVVLNFKMKGLWWAVFFISVIALTDMTGNYVFKHGFERLRPCNDPDFFEQVRLLIDHCGAGYSFTSNHAANHFGMAAFFFVTFRHLLKKGVWAVLAWAALIAYAQVYVGVHYPLDVFCGALLGLVFGITMGSLFNKQFGFAIFDK